MGDRQTLTRLPLSLGARVSARSRGRGAAAGRTTHRLRHKLERPHTRALTRKGARLRGAHVRCTCTVRWLPELRSMHVDAPAERSRAQGAGRPRLPLRSREPGGGGGAHTSVRTSCESWCRGQTPLSVLQSACTRAGQRQTACPCTWGRGRRTAGRRRRSRTTACPCTAARSLPRSLYWRTSGRRGGRPRVWRRPGTCPLACRRTQS